MSARPSKRARSAAKEVVEKDEPTAQPALLAKLIPFLRRITETFAVTSATELPAAWLSEARVSLRVDPESPSSLTSLGTLLFSTWFRSHQKMATLMISRLKTRQVPICFAYSDGLCTDTYRPAVTFGPDALSADYAQGGAHGQRLPFFYVRHLLRDMILAGDADGEPLRIERHLVVTLYVVHGPEFKPRRAVLPLLDALALLYRTPLMTEPLPGSKMDAFRDWILRSLSNATADAPFVLPPSVFSPLKIRAPPCQLKPFGPTCSILRDSGESLEDTLGEPPIWIHIPADSFPCSECVHRAKRTSVDGKLSFAVQSIVRFLKANCGMRLDTSTGDVFGRSPLSVPILACFFVQPQGSSKGCLFGCDLVPSHYADVQEMLVHGSSHMSNGIVERGNAALDFALQLFCAGQEGMAAAKYLIWSVHQVEKHMHAERGGGVFGLTRFDPHRPIGNVSDAGRGTGSSSPAVPWCRLCNIECPCLRSAPALLASPHLWEDVISAAGPEVRDRLVFWRQSAERYVAAVIEAKAEAPFPAADVPAVAVACCAAERIIDRSCGLLCPTCDTRYVVERGCTHMNCVTCGEHHCNCCLRRFARADQPRTERDLWREVAAVIDREGGEEAAPGPVAPCKLAFPHQIASVFALTAEREKALRSGAERRSSDRYMGCQSRFFHSNSTPEGVHCPTYQHDFLDELAEDPDETLFRIPKTNFYDETAHSIYKEFAMRFRANGAVEDEGSGGESAEFDLEAQGMLAVFRIVHGFRAVIDGLPSCAEFNSLRFMWPVMWLEARRWSFSVSDPAALPLSTLSAIQLLSNLVVSRAVPTTHYVPAMDLTRRLLLTLHYMVDPPPTLPDTSDSENGPEAAARNGFVDPDGVFRHDMPQAFVASLADEVAPGVYASLNLFRARRRREE
jgi:hypothetical protein